MKIPKEVRQDRLPVGSDSSKGDNELDDVGMVRAIDFQGLSYFPGGYITGKPPDFGSPNSC